MAVLGVVACQVLEHELASLLAADGRVQRVTIVHDAASARLVDLVTALRKPALDLVPCVESFLPEPGPALEVLVRVLPMQLHLSRKRLRRSVLSAARSLAPHCRALLLTYGSCAGLHDLRDDPALQQCPVFVPTEDDRPVDDCVGLLLGGRRRYLEEQRQVPGTFFVTPGWSEHWREMASEAESQGTGFLHRLWRGYRRVLLLPSAAMDEQQMQRNISEFAERLHLRLETRKGSLALLEAAWMAASGAGLPAKEQRNDSEGRLTG